MDSIKGLFFDLDGTLVDTLDANVHAYQKAAEEVGINITRKQLADSFGMRYDKIFRAIHSDITDEELENIRELKAKYYPEFLHLSRPNRQLIDFVKTLREDHITVLVTMAQRQNALAVLESAGIFSLFDHMVTGDEVTHPKPHPEAFKLALERAGLNPSEALAFEDSESGIASATSAGLATLKITIPPRKPE